MTPKEISKNEYECCNESPNDGLYGLISDVCPDTTPTPDKNTIQRDIVIQMDDLHFHFRQLEDEVYPKDQFVISWEGRATGNDGIAWAVEVL